MKRHDLPLINILDKNAAILASAEVYKNNGEPSDVYSPELPSAFAGLDRFVARKAIVAAFDDLDFLVEVKEHDLVAPYGDRSGVIIEPLLTDQWYVRTAPLAGPAVDAVANGEIEIVPKQYENMYNAWMSDVQDWCISRQLCRLFGAEAVIAQHVPIHEDRKDQHDVAPDSAIHANCAKHSLVPPVAVPEIMYFKLMLQN